MRFNKAMNRRFLFAAYALRCMGLISSTAGLPPAPSVRPTASIAQAPWHGRRIFEYVVVTTTTTIAAVEFTANRETSASKRLRGAGTPAKRVALPPPLTAAGGHALQGIRRWRGRRKQDGSGGVQPPQATPAGRGSGGRRF